MNTIIRILPDGRVRIHWFCRDYNGAATAPAGLIPVMKDGEPVLENGKQKFISGAVKGFIACNRGQREVTPQYIANTVEVCNHSDDPRAVSCPECLATAECQAALAELDRLQLARA